jgi:hypothetical protein
LKSGKYEVVACGLSKEFSANLRNVSTNRMREISLCCLAKEF